jgi:DMSO reductase family type II enzyme iron-sulfur subunit
MVKRLIKEELKKSKRQYAMILDLNKCLGCHACSMACKKLWTEEEGMDYMWWNNVNTMPGKGGYPRGWEKSGGGFDGDRIPRAGRLPTMEEYGKAWKFDYEGVFAKGAEKDWIKPEEVPKWGPNWDEDVAEGEYPNCYYFYMPRLCNHCTNPACLEACPRNAIYKRNEDGIVLIDQERCRGYRYCIEACPYKKIYFNYTAKKSQKCVFCFPRIEKGTPNACARQCPGRLRFVGFLDDKRGPIFKLVKKWNVALPLHPEFNTEPNVYYVPPLSPFIYDSEGNLLKEERIPLNYLEYLFGKSVRDALNTIKEEREKVRRGGKSELMDILIARVWKENFKLG